MNDYILMEEIGKGNASIVYKGRKKKTVDFFAIYSIEKSKRARVLNNVSVLRSMTSESVIRFHNWYETANHLWVITELCIGGDLRSILSHDHRMEKNSVRLLGGDIAAGLHFIHSKGFVYRDLKPGNLLMDSTAMLRFYDFGLSCLFGAASEKTPVGTPHYMAPELFIVGTSGAAGRRGPVPGVPSVASDLWSLGCVLYEMASGATPFAGKDLEEVLRGIFTVQPRRLAHMDDSFNDLVLRLLEKDPLKRATWKDVCASSFWDSSCTRLRSRDALPREPAFDAYRREVENSISTPVLGASPWSDEDIDVAVQSAVGAAMANLASSPAFNEEEEGFGELDPSKEVDFTPPSGFVALSSAAADAATARRSTGNAATGSLPRHPPGSPHAVHGSYVTSRIGSADANLAGDALPIGTRRQSNNFTGGAMGSEQRASLASNRGSNGTHASSSRALNYFTNGDRLTRSQLMEIAGKALSATNVCDFVWHSTDSNTRPLYGNARIEKYVEPSFDATGFSFQPLKRSELKGLEERVFGSFIRSVYKQLSNSASDAALKRNILHYIETIASETSIANMLVNSSIMTLCIDQMEATTMPTAFRTAAASVAGMLIRYACQISPLAARTKVIPRLLQLFRAEANMQVKRKVFVCIGELVFYVYTQDESERAQWGIVPAELERTFVSALATDDDLVRHYAAKTIENLSTSYGKAEPVATAQVVEHLLLVFDLPPASTRNHHMRSSALCAALRLATLREELIPLVLRSGSLARDAYGGIATASPIARTSQVLLAFLVAALLNAMAATRNAFPQAWIALPGCSADAKRMLTSSLSAAEAEDVIRDVAEISEDLTDRLCEHSERSSVSLRGKTLLLYVVLGCLGGTLLPKLCTSRNVASLDRIVREDDAYIQQCGTALGSYFSIYVPEKLGAVVRKASPTTTPLYLSSCQQIMSAGTLRGKMDLPQDTFKSLGDGVQKALTNSAYAAYEEDFVTLADRITQVPDAVVQFQEPICAHLVPPYVDMLQRKESQRKFSALRFLVSVTLPLSSDSRVQRDRNGAVGGAVGRAVAVVIAAASKALTTLLGESNPIPSYTLRLLATCGECSPAALAGILSTSFLGSVMAYLSAASTEGDLFYPLKLLHIALSTSSNDEYITYVVKQKLLPTVLSVLRSAMGSGMDYVLEVACELAAMVLARGLSVAPPRFAVQCSGELMEGDALTTVFMPLATTDSGNPLVNEKAAQVVYHLVGHSFAAQNVMLSSRGIACLTELLSKQPVNPAATEWMLKAARLAAENMLKPEVQQRLGSQDRLLAALDSVSGRGSPRAVAAEAVRLASLIKG